MMHVQKQNVPPRLKSKQFGPKHKIPPQIEGTLGLFSAQPSDLYFPLMFRQLV